MEGFKAFGDLLRRYREEAGLSQNALARASGMNPTNVNRIEHSKQGVPRKTTIIKLVRGLGLSLSDERAQQLLAAANLSLGPSPMRPAVLGAPLRRPRTAKAALRELKTVFLRAVDLITELEEMIDNEEK